MPPGCGVPVLSSPRAGVRPPRPVRVPGEVAVPWAGQGHTLGAGLCQGQSTGLHRQLLQVLDEVYFQNSFPSLFDRRGFSPWQSAHAAAPAKLRGREDVGPGLFYLTSTSSNIASHHRTPNRWTCEPGEINTFGSSDFITALSLKGFEVLSVSHK